MIDTRINNKGAEADLKALEAKAKATASTQDNTLAGLTPRSLSSSAKDSHDTSVVSTPMTP